jgi:hypothetical protein
VEADRGETMKRVRVSVAALVFAVALVAVNCVLIRNSFVRDALLLQETRGVSLMANVLAIGAYLYRARYGRSQPHMAGFIMSGIAVAVLYQVSLRVAYDVMYDYQSGLALRVALTMTEFIRRNVPSDVLASGGGSVYRWLFYGTTIPAISLVIGLPQLFIALAVGRMVGTILRRADGRRAARRSRPGRSRTVNSRRSGRVGPSCDGSP